MGGHEIQCSFFKTAEGHGCQDLLSQCTVEKDNLFHALKNTISPRQAF